MTPRLRTTRALSLAALPPTLALSALLSWYGTSTAYAAGPTPAGSTSYAVQLVPASHAVRPTHTTPASHAAEPRPALGLSGSPARRPSYAAAGPDAAQPSPVPSLAGSMAGEGRARPGREEVAPREQQEEDAGATYTDRDPTAPADNPSVPGRDPDVPDPAAPTDPGGATLAPDPARNTAAAVGQSVTRSGQDAEPVLQILPLGSGLILIGLGLGLVFLALRVRRG